MTHFISREKMGKKARKALNNLKRRTWPCSPVTRTVESKKKDNRHRIEHDLQMKIRVFCYLIFLYATLPYSAVDAAETCRLFYFL